MSATYSFSSLLQEGPKYLKECKGTLYIVEFRKKVYIACLTKKALHLLPLY